MRRPDFFIVGAPKCGTTALYQYLRQHPDIYMPDRKEPNFFCTDLDASDPYAIRDGGAYLALFAGASAEKRVGEASVWNLYSKSAAAAIKAFNADAAIIIMLRDPVDMLHALHSQRFYSGYEDIADFRTALEAEEDRKRGARLPRGVQLVQGLFYREVGKYAQQVQRYFDAFGRERVHVIVYDDLKDDTPRVYRDTLRFLDVDAAFRPALAVVNANKRVRIRSVHRFMRRQSAPRRIARALTPPPLKGRLGPWITRFNTRVDGRPPMAPDLRRALQAELAPDVERLSALLDRDLTHWVRPR